MISDIFLKISIDFEDPELSKIVYDALLPETVSAPTERSKASLNLDDSKLLIIITSEDPVSTRAAFNSYLRWITAILDTIDVIK